MDPTANLTFNLRLSDQERQAKEKLALPFVFSKEKYPTLPSTFYENVPLFKTIKTTTNMHLYSFLFICFDRKSALLRPGPGSGRILYEPDANDDYDQEDPDDDLDI